MEEKEMRVSIAIFVLTTIFLSAACKKDAIPVELSNVCSPDNEKKYISTSGFLEDKGGVFCSNIGGGRMDCGFAVTASPGGDKVFSADIEQGSGANKVERLEAAYTKEDIKIRDNKLVVVKPTDKVMLTGQMSIAPDGSVCFMTVDNIER